MDLPQNTKAEKLYLRALTDICKLLRENPMADIGLYPDGLINILPNGSNRDPNGTEYLTYFLTRAAKEIKAEETNTNE